MMKTFLPLILLLACVGTGSSRRTFPNFYGDIKSRRVVGDPGEPLLLTPYIEANRIEEAQNASFADWENFKSYSGYLTVDKRFDSNLFFWYFPAQKDPENAPLILWLQGGPGATSMFGLFEENGPLIPVKGGNYSFRDINWAVSHNVIYIDNPVGTGFSYTNGGYAENQTKVGEDLYNGLQQFFALFPNLRNNSFFITGESYAGKYVPAIAYTILKRSNGSDPKINLQGLAIGNGVSDPGRQLVYGSRLYQLGFIDSKTRTAFHEAEAKFVQYIQDADYYSAVLQMNVIMTTYDGSLFWDATHFRNVYNLLVEDDVQTAALDEYLEELVSVDTFRRKIHVGNVTFGDNNVGELLTLDIPQSVTPWVSELLSHYRVLIYNGQMDLLVAYPQTVEYLQNLTFSSAEEYRTAERHPWFVEGSLAGYFKTAGNLTDVVVRNAGHMVPTDQPEWSLDLITRFTRNQPFEQTASKKLH